MRGRTPKAPETRRRRNKASTAAVLDPNDSGREAPLLPEELGEIHPLTKRWWGVIWRSPMASRWLDADVEGLYLIAILRNEFFQQRTSMLAAEIRQQETRFGLDVLSRRRLDWRIAGPTIEDAPGEPEPAPFPDDFDIRSVLKAVK